MLVVTIKGLKQFTGHLQDGFSNLHAHYMALKQKCKNIVVTYNEHIDDDPEDVNALIKYCIGSIEHGIIKNSCFTDGGNGATLLASKVIELIDKNSIINSVYTYHSLESVDKKIDHILKDVYGYNSEVKVEMSDEVLAKYSKIAYNSAFSGYDVCIAKTQYSMNDDPEYIPLTGYKPTFTITDIEVNNGAEMIIISAGNMMRMPGLPKVPQATKIDFKDNKIINLS